MVEKSMTVDECAELLQVRKREKAFSLVSGKENF